MTPDVVVLVVAKAPVAGFAKTRLCPPATPAQAAHIAASALLDTLHAVRATPGVHGVVALTGQLDDAVAGVEIASLLRRMTVIEQRGTDFAERLVQAHADTAAVHPGCPILQIGMDTPQVTPALLGHAAGRLRAGAECLLGPAGDGGWWALGLRDPSFAKAVATVPMSTSDTGRLTRRALESVGLTVDPLPTLSDVDTMTDARHVAGQVPGSRFAAAVARVLQEAP